MGSVGTEFACPWCGRVDVGGYSPDQVGYAICASGQYDCLTTKFLQLGITTKAEYDALVLKWIFCVASGDPLEPLLLKFAEY